MRAFVGRERDLAVLEQALARAPTAVWIGGEPGIGKTRLAEVFCERAYEAGALVLFSRSWDGGGAPPYFTIAQMLRTLGEPMPAAPIERFELFERVTATLHRAAADRQVIAVVDDLHAADVSTLVLLRFLCRAPTRSKLLVVGTHRTVDGARDADVQRALAELLREGVALHLGGLSPPAISEWLRESEIDLAAAELAGATAGNPLFIDGVLRARASGQGLASEVRGAIAARIAHVSRRELLDMLAVIGRPATLSLLSRVLATAYETLLRDVGEAVTAGLLAEEGAGAYRFHHPLVQEVVYDALDPAARPWLHQRVLDALTEIYGAESSAHLPELARHALAAATPSTAASAVSLCRAAGRRAMEMAAFAEAAHAFADAHRALGLLPDPAPPPELLAELGEAELAAGHSRAARDAFEALADLARARADAGALGVAALGFARTFEFAILEPRRLQLLEEAAGRLSQEVHTNPSLRSGLSRVLARLAQELWMVAGREASRAELAERAIAMAQGDDEALAFALNAYLLCVWGPEHAAMRTARAEDLLRVADRSGNLERLLEAHRWRVNAAVEAGDLSRAEATIGEYSRVAEALRRPDYLANAMMRKALIPQWRGDFARAEELALSTRELQRRAGDPQADVVYDSRAIMLGEARGDREAVVVKLPAMREHVAARPRFALYRAIYLHGLLVAGDRAAAEAEWATLWANDLADVSRDMMLPPTLSLLVAPCIALADRARAERLHALLSPLVPMHAAIGASYSLGPTADFVASLAAFLGKQASSHVARATFRNEGATWLLEHGGKSTRVANGVGIRYLHTLVGRPGAEVHVLDLVGGSSANGSLSTLDAKAREAYKRRADDLRDTIEEAESHGDRGRAARARAELSKLGEELSRAFGLGGRPRASGDAERARVSVAKAISRSLGALSKELPSLAAHLERSIRTGSFCSYDPDPRARIDWVF